MLFALTCCCLTVFRRFEVLIEPGDHAIRIIEAVIVVGLAGRTRIAGQLCIYNHLRSELLTNAIFLLSGDHEGTLIVPWPPYRYAITFGFPPAAGSNRM